MLGDESDAPFFGIAGLTCRGTGLCSPPPAHSPIFIIVPSKKACCDNPMCHTKVAHMFHLGLIKGCEEVVPFVDKGVLPFHPFLVHLEVMIMLSELLLMTFLPSFNN